MSSTVNDKFAEWNGEHSYIASGSISESLFVTFLPPTVRSRIPHLSSLRRIARNLSTPDAKSRPRPKSAPVYLSADTAGNVFDLYQHSRSSHNSHSHSSEVVTEEQHRDLERPDTPTLLPSLTHTPSPSAASSRPETPGFPCERELGLDGGTEGLRMDDRGQSHSRSRSDAIRASPSLQLSYARPLDLQHDNERQHTAVALATAQGLVQVANTPASPPELRRTLIIDAIRYLCQTLPSDLSDTEVERFHSGLPDRVQAYDASRKEVEVPRSSLRILVANTLTQLFLLVAFLIPYILYLLDALYRFERHNRFSERIIIAVLGFLTVCGDTGVNVQKAVDDFGQSEMGGYIVRGVQWTWQGVVGGFGDGVGEGWRILHDRMNEETVPDVQRTDTS